MAGLVESVKKFFSKKERTKRRDQRAKDVVLDARLERFTAREKKKEAARLKRAIVNGK